MEIVFLASAEAEFIDAISYYNMQSEGLGYEFAAEVNPVRNSSGALNPAGIILKSNPAAKQRGIISNGVKRTIERIIQYPEAWFKLSKRTHRCRTNRFPYGIIYQVRAEILLIVAVMHLSREPQTWKSRLRNKEL